MGTFAKLESSVGQKRRQVIYLCPEPLDMTTILGHFLLG